MRLRTSVHSILPLSIHDLVSSSVPNWPYFDAAVTVVRHALHPIERLAHGRALENVGAAHLLFRRSERAIDQFRPAVWMISKRLRLIREPQTDRIQVDTFTLHLLLHREVGLIDAISFASLCGIPSRFH